MAIFESSVALEAAPEDVFDFLIRPQNLLKILPEDSGFTLSSAPETLEEGSQLEFSISGLGPTQHMTHEVTLVERPNRFVEKQIKGPLASFEHDHLVEPAGDGRTTLIDRIEFEPPGGMAGFLITEARVRETLEAGFALRHEALQKIFAGRTPG